MACQAAAIVCGLYGFCYEISLVTDIAVEGDTEIQGIVLHIQKVGLVGQDRHGKAVPFPTADTGAGEDPAISGKRSRIRLELLAIGFQVREAHEPDETAGNASMRSTHLPHGFTVGSKSRVMHQISHQKIENVIAGRPDFLAVILAGGIEGEDRTIRIKIGKHHFQIASGRFQIQTVTGCEVEADHLIVIDPVVCTGGAFCKLTVPGNIQTFPEVDIRPVGKVLSSGQQRGCFQRGGNGPAMVGRMKSACTDALTGGFNEVDELFKQSVPTGDIGSLQQNSRVHHGIDGKCRIGSGVEIAGGKVKESGGPFVFLHVVKRIRNGTEQCGRGMITALRMDISCEHPGCGKTGITRIRIQIRTHWRTALRVCMAHQPLDFMLQLPQHEGMLCHKNPSLVVGIAVLVEFVPPTLKS